MNAAQIIRERKAARPDLYCAHPLCLWRTAKPNGYAPCPKHQASEVKSARREESTATAASGESSPARQQPASAPLLSLHPKHCTHPNCNPDI